MSRVIEQHRATGRFEITFRKLPIELVAQVEELGHIAVTDARVDGPMLTDELLDAARYTGVVRFRRTTSGESDFVVRGAGLAYWLGTEDKLGDVLEEKRAYSAAPFADAIEQSLPDAIQPGMLVSTGLEPYTGSHQWQTPREIIDYICDTKGAEWRIRPNGRIDAGKYEHIFPATPRAVVVRQQRDVGDDMELRGMSGPGQADRDIEAFTTRAVILGTLRETTTTEEGESSTTETRVVQAAKDINPALNPYRDLFGNPVKMTRVVSESGTEEQNAEARAQLQIDLNNRPTRVVMIDPIQYDIHGIVECGDYVWVWDPEAGLEDEAEETVYRGQVIHPAREQVISIDWPITEAMGVYYRTRGGQWLDLSRWVDPVEGQTTLEIGKTERDIQNLPGGSSVVGRTPAEPDTSIPQPPIFLTPFPGASYAGDTGIARAQVVVRYQGDPLNTDGTAFVDGSHFEIRYRQAPAYPLTWAELSESTWSELDTWREPIDATVVNPDPWSIAYAPLDQNSVLLSELLPAARYEFQIRALDTANPPNASAWSATHVQWMPADDQPPPTPAAAIVAGSKIAIAIKHELGADTGGNYTLPLDLAYLQVHASTEGSGFMPSEATLLGKVEATRANINGQIPVVASFPVTTTEQLWVKVIAVDNSGNASDPSEAAAVTAELVDSMWISDLTATKITAGTISSTINLAGQFITGTSGDRMRMYGNGLIAYLANGDRFFDLDIAGQTVTVVGTYRSGFSGQRIEILREGTLRAYANDGDADYASMANRSGSFAFRSRTAAHGRRSFLELNPDGVTAYYGFETGTRYSVFTQGRTYSVLAAPVTGIRVFSHIAAEDGTPNRFHFVVSNNGLPSGDYSDSVIHYERRAAGGGVMVRPQGGAGAGVLWEAAGMVITTGDTAQFGTIQASQFIPASSGLVKTAPRVPVFGHDGAMSASDVIDAIPVWEYNYLHEVERPEKPNYWRTEIDEDGQERRVQDDWAEPLKPPTHRYYGPIAEEVRKIDPRLVVEFQGMDSPYGLPYQNQLGLLWVNAQDRNRQMRDLQSRVAELERLVLGEPPMTVDGDVLAPA